MDGLDKAKESGTFSYGALLRPMLRARTMNGARMGLSGLSLDLGSTQIYSGNKAALVDILRKQGNGPNSGGSECGNLENTFGTIRPL